MKSILAALVVLTIGAIDRNTVLSRPAEKKPSADFLASLPIPSGDPSLWQWDASTRDHVVGFLGSEGDLSLHRPTETVIPISMEYPRTLEGPPPPVGQGSGGVLYLNWTTGLKRLMDLSIDVTFHTEPKPAASVYLQLYDFPMVVPGTSVKVGQYFGFQYWFERGQLKTQFIWSRWNTRDKADAWVADGGWIESAGYEGDFVGIRYPYQCSKGTYTVHLAMRESDPVGTWYEMQIYNHQKSEWKKIGRLRFPRSADGLPFLEDNGGTWVEVFGGTKSSEDIGLFHYSIGGVYTCGRTVRARYVELKYADGTPNCDVAIDADGRRVHVMYGGQTRRVTPAGKYLIRTE
jgi:hypothetical protein